MNLSGPKLIKTSKLSKSARKALLQPSGIKEPRKLEANTWSLLMTTPSALVNGFNPLWTRCRLIQILQALVDQPQLPKGFDMVGTYSVIHYLNVYTMQYFWKEDTICLAILREPVLGLLARRMRDVLTKAKLIFLKPATWLFGSMCF